MGRVLAELKLSCHHDHPAGALRTCSVKLMSERRGKLCLEYDVTGDMTQLIIPERSDPVRADGLWQSTCFELFIVEQGGGYREYNFAPSGQWAIYDFTGYREGMSKPLVEYPPAISIEQTAERLAVTVRLSGLSFSQRLISLSAVIEETDGTKSYWALAHPPGEPDFHHHDCFALQLGAPDCA